MLNCINPERIICYNEPFDEMEGNIVYINYEKSSWMHMDDDIVTESEEDYRLDNANNKLLKKISIGYTIKRRGYILPNCEEKGMGSAYGGKWKPKK